MNLTLWRPQNSMLSFGSEVDRLFDSLWRSPFFETPVNLVPPMEATENENEYRVKMEIPGIEEKDLSITLQDGVLSVKGEKKTEGEKKDEMCYCSEVSYGSFERAVSIPSNIDAEKVAAQYKNGVLVITLPKREEAKPKKIEVKVK